MPPAIDLRSPAPPSVPGNPKPEPPAAGRGGGEGLEPRGGRAPPPQPRRRKPRLVKVRRRAEVRPAAAAAGDEVGSVCNPFRAECDAERRVRYGSVVNLCSEDTRLSNGDGAIGPEVECSFEDVGFVFGAPRRSSALDMDFSASGATAFVGEPASDDDGARDRRKFESAGFVLFGAERRDLELNSGLENGNSGGDTQKSAFGNGADVGADSARSCGNLDDFSHVCNSNKTAPEPNLNLGKGGCGRTGPFSCCKENGKAKLETEVHAGNAGFSSVENEYGLESVSEREQSSDDVEEAGCIDGKASRSNDNAFFMFGADHGQSTSVPWSEKGSTRKERELKENGDSGFVFGSSWFSLGANLNTKTEESRENLENLELRDNGDFKLGTEVEPQRTQPTEALSNEGHGNGLFVFKGSSEKISIQCKRREKSSNTGMTLDGDNFGNRSSDSDEQIVNLGSNDMENNKSASICSAGAAGSSSTLDLPENMQDLSIEDRRDTGGANDGNNSTNSEAAFVFRSGPCVSNSFHGNLATPMGQTKNPNFDGLSDPAESGSSFAKVEEGQFIFNNYTNIACESTGISSHKPFIFQAGISESSDMAQCSSNPVNDSTLAENLDNKEKFSFTNTLDGSGASNGDFRVPEWDPSCFKANLCQDLKIEFNEKRRTTKYKKYKKNAKLRQPSKGKLTAEEDHGLAESNCQEMTQAPDCYSPMDFSPYQEAAANDQCSRQSSSVTLDESIAFSNENAALASSSTIPTTDGHMGSSMERLVSDEGNSKFGETVSGAEAAHFKPSTDHPCSTFGAAVASAEDGSVFSIAENQATDYMKQSAFASNLDEVKYKTFVFSASSSAQTGLLDRKRLHKKKSRVKSENCPFVISPCPGARDGSFSMQLPNSFGTSFPSDTKQGQEGRSRLFQEKEQNILNSNGNVIDGETNLSSSAMIQEACEKWRLRGNQAYKNGRFSRAEEYYAKGVNSVPSGEASGYCLKPLLLCYSNRAATRMSLGRIREAIEDCIAATTIDPNFLKVQIRAANCHLILGEVENASNYFNKCLATGADICLDRRLVIEAADGLQKAQKVAECISLSTKMLEEKTSDAATRALEMLSEAISISKFSEKLLEMKAQALHMLRKYDDVVKLCEQSLKFAEKNFGALGVNLTSDMVDSDCGGNSAVRLWRFFMMAKSYFCLGRLEEALELLEKIEQTECYGDRCQDKILKSSASVSSTIRRLLKCKNAGNEAFRLRSYAEAVEHYSIALSSNVESRPFAAICFCNRAAAHQAMGQIADAIADCSLAIALDGHYAKAVSRRATLHELIRDYKQAASDVQRFISILENPSHQKTKASGTSGELDSRNNELRKAKKRWSLIEEEAKKGTPLDVYLILGVKQSETAADIKKAYHKAALRHHPDKAGQCFARSESGNEGLLWKEIATEVHESADRLFKIIGEAYAVLSDPSKRAEYDLEEDIRKAHKESSGYGNYKSASHFQSSPFERGSSRRNWQESWKTHGYSRSQW
ncbi:uncharacterized protein LOC115678635 isoform X1 [Syzygium oleosum]|uniref:uncharacterized protein LOC115678635 isoform X1 n=1 Tax=Syzygium oleosum TaxID=219896 RepID=UPI0024BB512C|nr:uncharacterized protein LOC115678635 isoform X1 [Syzygium oleosum]